MQTKKTRCMELTSTRTPVTFHTDLRKKFIFAGNRHESSHDDPESDPSFLLGRLI